MLKSSVVRGCVLNSSDTEDPSTSESSVEQHCPKTRANEFFSLKSLFTSHYYFFFSETKDHLLLTARTAIQELTFMPFSLGQREEGQVRLFLILNFD